MSEFKERRKLSPASIFLLLSAVFHVGIWLSVLLLPEHRPMTADQSVEVSYISPEQAERLRTLDQIVEQKNRVNDELDKNAKYLSAFNQKIIKQTKAENVGKFNNTPAGGAVKNGQKANKEARKQEHKKAVAKGELPTLRELSPTFSPTPGIAAQPVPNPGEVTQSDDYLNDVQKGLQTLLSTREFVYYSYYQRIKQQISQYWEPNVRERVKIIYRTGRTIASTHDRVTQLLITLDKSGRLVRIEVLGESGVHDLDDAAIEAFKSAAPFPNPPKGMVEKDGTIKIRWDFVLEARNERDEFTRAV